MENQSFEALAENRGRKVPNLKNLRDMIKKNTTGQSPKKNQQANVKSERTNKNESECSFTLTSDEEKEAADGQTLGTRKSSLRGKRSRSKGSQGREQQPPVTQETQPVKVAQ